MPRELKLYNVTNNGGNVGFSGGGDFRSGLTKQMRLSSTEAETLRAQNFTVEENGDSNAEPNFWVAGWSSKRDD